MEFQNEQSFYQTGYTQPPKSHRGIIALLLITIVILGSVATMLGLLNIQLFQQLSMQSNTTDSVQFAQLSTEYTRQSNSNVNTLGFSVKTLSAFDQNLYQLPQGVYITEVSPGSSAAKLGVLPGDILLSVQNTPINDAESLDQYLHTCVAGQSLTLFLFRDGQQYSVDLSVGGMQ